MQSQRTSTTIRQVVQEHKATTVLDAEIGKYPNLSEVYRSLEWRLARQPEAGHRVPSSNPESFVIHANEWVDAPQLVLLYHFTDDTVTITGARTVLDPASSQPEKFPKAV